MRQPISLKGRPVGAVCRGGFTEDNPRLDRVKHGLPSKSRVSCGSLVHAHQPPKSPAFPRVDRRVAPAAQKSENVRDGRHEVIAGNLATSVAICVAGAVLEGVCAGSGVKAFFATLRAPRHSAPLPVWYAIGVVYYATFGCVLYRLLGLPDGDPLTRGTLALVAAMMNANAVWNLIFFRARNLLSLRSSSAALPRSLTWYSSSACSALICRPLLALVPYSRYPVLLFSLPYTTVSFTRTLVQAVIERHRRGRVRASDEEALTDRDWTDSTVGRPAARCRRASSTRVSRMAPACRRRFAQRERPSSINCASRAPGS